MQFFGNEQRASYALLIIVSSDSVGVGVVESRRSEAFPKLIFSSRTPLRQGVDEDSTRKAREGMMTTALSAFGDGLRALTSHEPSASISHLYVASAAPWAYTTSHSIKEDRDESLKITQSVILGLTKKAEDEVMKRVKEHEALVSDDFEIVEKVTVGITVNDYEVFNPVGLKGVSLGLTHVAGLVPASLVRTMEEVHEKLLPTAQLHVHTSMLVTYCVLRDALPHVQTHCIIQVTGEATEFGFVEHGTLIHNSYVSSGTDTFIRDVEKLTGRPKTDILTSLIEECTDSVVDTEAFAPVVRAYEERVGEFLKSLLVDRVMPEHVTLLVAAPFVSIFKNMIERTLDKTSGVTCIVAPLNADEVLPNKEFSSDIFLATCARFFHKLEGCAELNREE